MALIEKIVGTTSASPNAETIFPHSLGVVPDFVELVSKGAGIVYLRTPTFYSASNIHVSANVASLPFEARLIVDHSIIK
jgi:hypothetical protein